MLSTWVHEYESQFNGGQKQIELRRHVNSIIRGEPLLPLKVRKNTAPYHSGRYDFLFDPTSKLTLSLVNTVVRGKQNRVWAPLSLTVTHNGHRFHFKHPKYVGKGHYGSIVSYHDADHDLSIVLKIEGGWSALNKTPVPTERKIGEVVSAQNKIIRSRYITTRGIFTKTHYYLMQNLTGNCLSLISTLYTGTYDVTQKYKFWLDAVEEIRKQIGWLFRHGYYFIDIKLHNILYSVHDSGISFHLADLGGAVPDQQGKHYTGNKFVPTCHSTGIVIDNKKTAKAIILYLLGILACEIANDYKNDVYVSSLENYTYYDTHKMYANDLDTFLKKTNFTQKQKKVLRNLLAWEPAKRLRLDLFKPFRW